MHLRPYSKDGMDAENLSDLIKKYLIHRRYSKETARTYTSYLGIFASAMPAGISDIKLEHIEQHVIRYAKKHEPSTVTTHTRIIKSFYNWLGREGVTDLGRLIAVEASLPSDQRILSRNEYDRVCACVDGYLLDGFKFLCNTGLRASEFMSLTPNNIGNGFLRVIGKRRKTRSIPLNKTASEIVLRNARLEFIKSKNPLWIWRQCKKIGENAGIAEFHPHSCRHYFANELYHRGVPIATISRLLGHSSTAVTETVYVHWSEESLKGTTDLLED